MNRRDFSKTAALGAIVAPFISASPKNEKTRYLFLEDTNEELYRIDRLMAQLQLSGILKGINGFIFGKCTNCRPGSGYGSLTFDEIIDHYIKPLGIPAFSGSMIGHIDEQFTLPIGTEAEINADKGTFKLLAYALAQKD